MRKILDMCYFCPSLSCFPSSYALVDFIKFCLKLIRAHIWVQSAKSLLKEVEFLHSHLTKRAASW